MTIIEVDCPSCGTVAFVDPSARTSDEFCQHCDFPLFWAAETKVPGEVTGEGLKRLPGMAGRRTVGSLECRSCAELNAVSAEVCIRCGDSLIIVFVEPEPDPEPEPEPVPIIRPPIGPMWPIYFTFLLLPTIILLLMLLIIDI